jgi:hypothetical protein
VIEVATRTCGFTKEDGHACGAPPLLDDDFCFWHSPKCAKEAAEARRQGGLRRRREKIVSTAFEFEGLRTVEGIQRYLEMVGLDTLTLENSAKRSHAAARIASVALHALDRGEIEQLLQTLEAARGPR